MIVQLYELGHCTRIVSHALRCISSTGADHYCAVDESRVALMQYQGKVLLSLREQIENTIAGPRPFSLGQDCRIGSKWQSVVIAPSALVDPCRFGFNVIGP